MIIELWFEFLLNIITFTPFIIILACILGVSCILLIRSFKVW